MPQSTFGIQRAFPAKGSGDPCLSRSIAVSHGPRTSLIDAEWGTTDSLQSDGLRDSVPVESEVRRCGLDAMSQGPRTSLIDAEWGTTDSLQPDGLRDWVPVSPRLVAARRNRGWLPWLACSIVVLGGLSFGISNIGANRVTSWSTNGVPPVPPSVPVVVPKPRALIAPLTPATVTTSHAIPAHAETMSEPLVLSPKASLKTVNRRSAAHRKAPSTAPTSHQLPSVVAFEDL